MKKLLDLDTLDLPRVHAATTWSWYFEGDRFFEGTRSLFTAANFATPLLNAYRLLARLPEQRLHAVSNRGRGLRQLQETEPQAELDGLAAGNGRDRLAVAVWHHSDDQYHQDSAPVAVTLRHLPFAGRAVRLCHYRIDGAHSNSHTAWVAAGRPQCPTPGQLDAIRAREGLEPYEPDRLLDPAPGDLTITFELPLPGVSLLECEV
jgi:xylan 1,4-beta-xylosidase